MWCLEKVNLNHETDGCGSGIMYYDYLCECCKAIANFELEGSIWDLSCVDRRSYKALLDLVELP